MSGKVIPPLNLVLAVRLTVGEDLNTSSTNINIATPYEFLFAIENPIMEERQFFANSTCTIRGFTAELGKILF